MDKLLPCPNCDGKGSYDDLTCSFCEGDGTVSADTTTPAGNADVEEETLAQHILFPPEHCPVHDVDHHKIFSVKYGEAIALVQAGIDAATAHMAKHGVKL